jgi:outer membrane protein assembly factor BamD (BamD/ComL family)
MAVDQSPQRRARTSTSFLLVASLAITVSCKTTETAQSVKTGPVEYSVNAQNNYEAGVKDLARHDRIAATKYFNFVVTMFPDSKWELLAELGLADVQFDAQQYQKAADMFRQFKTDHPLHELVENGYVSYRIGEATGMAKCGQCR